MSGNGYGRRWTMMAEKFVLATRCHITTKTIIRHSHYLYAPPRYNSLTFWYETLCAVSMVETISRKCEPKIETKTKNGIEKKREKKIVITIIIIIIVIISKNYCTCDQETPNDMILSTQRAHHWYKWMLYRLLAHSLLIVCVE